MAFQNIVMECTGCGASITVDPALRFGNCPYCGRCNSLVQSAKAAEQPVVENIFPVSNKREDRYVLGNSMGSHGAFKWALNCPEFFAAAAGMSGAGDLEELGFYDRMPNRVINSFGTLEEYRNSYNDFKYLYGKLLKEGSYIPRFYACCGTEDGFYYGAKKFAVDAKAQGFPILFEEGEGGHEWGFWDRWLPIMLDHMLKED